MPTTLRALLVILGLILTVIGLNVALGGIHTMGWQYPPGFASVAVPEVFNMQDSHVRFLGGIYASCGMILIITAFRPALAPAAVTVCVMSLIGGLFRLIDMDAALFRDFAIVRSLIGELLIIPGLGYWLWFETMRGH